MVSHQVLAALADHPATDPVAYTILDYSGFEGSDIPPGQAADAGVVALFTRITMGTSGIDPAGPRRLAALRAQTRLIPGVYHYAHEQDPAGQVTHFAAVAGDVTGLLVQYDWELDPSTNRPVSVASATAWVEAFRARYPGHPLIGYLPRWVASQLGYPNLAGLFDALWASDYSSPYDWSPYCGYIPALLQYTDHALGGADASYYRGTLTDLHALTGGDDVMPDYGNLGPPKDVPTWISDHPDILTADVHAAIMHGVSGWGDGSAVWLVGQLTALQAKLDALTGAVGHLTVPPAPQVDVTALAAQLRDHLGPDLIAALAQQLAK